MSDLTCIHSDKGLCPRCQADYEEDPEAWIEFGDHPEGIARQRELEEEIDREMREHPPPPLDDDDIPF